MTTNANLLMLNEWLSGATRQLEQAGITTARLDCLVLLEDATGKGRAWLLAHPEFVINDMALQKLSTWIAKRKKHEPLAYLRGKTEFYGRDFTLNKKVLEPRPESENMIDFIKQLCKELHLLRVGPLAVVDVGTGSGAIGITAALEIPCKVFLTDIDPECLKIAKINAKKYGVKADFLQGNLLEPLDAKLPAPYTILANLPYVPDHYEINKAALMEPKIAIFGGQDGLDLYRRLFGQVSKMQHKPEFILTESLPFQHQELTNIASSYNFALKESSDFIQVFCTKIP